LVQNILLSAFSVLLSTLSAANALLFGNPGELQLHAHLFTGGTVESRCLLAILVAVEFTGKERLSCLW